MAGGLTEFTHHYWRGRCLASMALTHVMVTPARGATEGKTGLLRHDEDTSFASHFSGFVPLLSDDFV